MKLIIATSLGQGWLINHPECKVDNSTHAVFFTACSANEQLHNKGTEAFHKWMESTSGAKITPRTLHGGNDIDTLLSGSFLTSVCMDIVRRTYKMETNVVCK